jgi:hypothetical protein
MSVPMDIAGYELELKKALAAEDFERLSELDKELRNVIESLVAVPGKTDLQPQLERLQALYEKLVGGLKGKRQLYAKELGRLQKDKKGANEYRKAK